MNKLTKFSLAAGVPLAVLAGFGHPASAGRTRTLSPSQTAVPAGWQTLVDDTGLLTVAVPGEWTDVSTAPGANEDGSPRPLIEAAPNLEEFHNSFSIPGVTYLAIPATTDLAAALETFDVGDCADETTQPYDDGVFTGTVIHQTGCSPDGAEFVKVAANDAQNPAVTLVIEIGIATPLDQPVVTSILQSFGFSGTTPTPTATTVPAVVPTVPGGPAVPTVPGTPTVPTVPGTPTVPAVPTVPTGPGTPTVPGTPTLPTVPGATVVGPSGPVALDAVPVIDDTMLIDVSLPADWSDVSTAPATFDGVQQPTIIASPDISVFLPAETDTFAAPGLIYTAAPYNADPAVVLGETDMSGVCTPDGAPQPYADGIFTGLLQRYSNCGGTQTRIVTVAANPADGAFTASLLIQLTDADDTDLNTILGSFGYDPGAYVPDSPSATPTTVASS